MNSNEKILALCESFRNITAAVRAELDGNKHSTILVHNTLQHMSVLMTKEPMFRKLAADINFRLEKINEIAKDYGYDILEVYERYVVITNIVQLQLEGVSDKCKLKTNINAMYGHVVADTTKPKMNQNIIITPYNQFKPCGSIYIFEYAKLSTKHRHPAMAEADRPKDGGTPVQIVSTVKDNRQPFITPAELDQAVISALHDKVSKLERENAELREWKNRTLRILNQ